MATSHGKILTIEIKPNKLAYAGKNTRASEITAMAGGGLDEEEFYVTGE